MRRSLMIATATGAVLVAGGLAVPALAATGPANGSGGTTGTCRMTGGTCTHDGTQAWGRGAGGPGRGRADGSGGGMGAGMGMGAGAGMRGRSGDPLAGLPQGTLTAAQKQSLAGMAEEEKLAHDVYVALAAKTGDSRFTRISGAEIQHLTEVRALLARYGVTDPTAGKADGTFTSATVQKQYTDLVARGSASLDAAVAVGRDIEKTDIADLATARTDVTAPDVTTVYDRLTRGSQMHLRAFGG